MSVEEKLSKIEKAVSGIEIKLEHVETSVAKIENTVESKYVTQDEFRPVRMVTYGLIAILSTSVIASIIALVLK